MTTEGESSMQRTVTDFSRSWVRWSVLPDPTDDRTPGHMPWGNSVRIALDARCTIVDPTGSVTELFLIAPCRKEWMYRETGLIMDPGGEYRAIFSADRQLDVAMQARLDGDRPLPISTVGFESLTFEISEMSAEQLESDADVVAASSLRRPLVATTRIDNKATGFSAVLEYPIRTMNYHTDRERFQVDTGPLIFPDLEAAFEHPIERCRLAHTVYNTMDYAEFVCRPEGHEVIAATAGIGLRAYTEILQVPARHELYAGACGA